MSSAPRFTLMPGKKRVPRWRTKILPALASSPPYSFTPRRFDIESLPNLVEPAALVFDMLDQVKQFIKSNESELILALGVVLISLISFSAGRLSAPGFEKQSISVERLQPTSAKATVGMSAFENTINEDLLQALRDRTEGAYVASKNSNKYHLPNCSGAKRIAEHNKIWFNSLDEAESLGYTPAANCPGL